MVIKWNSGVETTTTDREQRSSSVCGPTGLVIPVRRATRRTTRAAPCRSSRCPSGPQKTGPSTRSPTARSIARAVRGASGMVTTLPPLRVITRVRCPRSTPRFRCWRRWLQTHAARSAPESVAPDRRPTVAGVPAHRGHGPVGEGLIAAGVQRKLEDGKPTRATEWLSRSPGERRPARDGSFSAAIRRIAEAHSVQVSDG